MVSMEAVMPIDVDDGGAATTGAGPVDATSSLVLKAQAGDLDAFERLYHEHVGRIHGLCLWMTRDRSQAEELTQEVFVRAWRKLALFRPGTAFSAWLHRLAVNLVISHRRKVGRQESATVLTAEVPESTSSVTARPDLSVDLQRRIDALPNGARTVLVLHDIYGYHHHEIAELTGIAVGTSKAQLHRARTRLREALR